MIMIVRECGIAQKREAVWGLRTVDDLCWNAKNI